MPIAIRHAHGATTVARQEPTSTRRTVAGLAGDAGDGRAPSWARPPTPPAPRRSGGQRGPDIDDRIDGEMEAKKA
jgi:hypothetical protein